jgi:hypothetical protein
MWTFNGEEVSSHEDLRPECTDIVYIIGYKTGQLYIGKKAVRAIRKKLPLKGKKRCRRIMTNIPFVNYEGSHEFKDLELQVESKKILYQCSTRKASTYLEAALLFYFDAIFEDKFLNKNISGKFFDNDLDGVIAEDLLLTKHGII